MPILSPTFIRLLKEALHRRFPKKEQPEPDESQPEFIREIPPLIERCRHRRFINSALFLFNFGLALINGLNIWLMPSRFMSYVCLSSVFISGVGVAMAFCSVRSYHRRHRTLKTLYANLIRFQRCQNTGEIECYHDQIMAGFKRLEL